MAKPYSDLEKQVLAILTSGGNPANSENKDVANYWAWKINPASSAHDLDGDSIRGTNRQLDVIVLIPFTTLPVASLKAKETISGRALLAATSKGLDKFGIAALAADSGAVFLGKFKPAKVYWRTGASAEAKPRTSRITRRKYKTRYAATDEGYSVPIGKGTGGTNFLARSTALTADLIAGQAVRPLISFSPEVFRG